MIKLWRNTFQVLIFSIITSAGLFGDAVGIPSDAAITNTIGGITPTFISTAEKAVKHNVKSAQMAAKERIFVNRWAKQTKWLYYEHKKEVFTKERIKMMFAEDI